MICREWEAIKIADFERLEAENARLREALEPFAHHSHPGWDTQSERRYRITVTEGQVARAWMALHEHEAER